MGGYTVTGSPRASSPFGGVVRSHASAKRDRRRQFEWPFPPHRAKFRDGGGGEKPVKAVKAVFLSFSLALSAIVFSFNLARGRINTNQKRKSHH